MSGHTPGPWEVKRHGYESPYMAHAFIEPGVAGIWLPDGNEEQAANARLIAAAPDLLEALKTVEVWVILSQARDHETTHPKAIQNAKDDHAKLRAAIAKAEGK